MQSIFETSAATLPAFSVKKIKKHIARICHLQREIFTIQWDKFLF
jgi:hypothetical protein